MRNTGWQLQSGGPWRAQHLRQWPTLLLQDNCHPQTIAVCRSRAEGLGLEVVVGPVDKFSIGSDVSGVLVQYPATDGSVSDYTVSTYRPCLKAS